MKKYNIELDEIDIRVLISLLQYGYDLLEDLDGPSLLSTEMNNIKSKLENIQNTTTII